MLVKPLQELNIPSGTLVIPFSKEKLVNESQFSKTFLPQVSTEVEIVTCWNPSQFENAPSSTWVTLAGREILMAEIERLRELLKNGEEILGGFKDA